MKDGAKVKGVVMEKEKLNGNMAYAEIALLVEIVSSLIYLYYLPVTAYNMNYFLTLQTLTSINYRLPYLLLSTDISLSSC